MLELHHRRFWIATSAVLVLGVVWGSLQTALGGAVPQGFDKVEHFSTYLFLAVWFTGIFARPRWWLVVAALLALGASMEAGQYLMGSGRTADIHDMDALQALLDSPPPEVAALMEAHGVLPPLTAYIEK